MLHKVIGGDLIMGEHSGLMGILWHILDNFWVYVASSLFPDAWSHVFLGRNHPQVAEHVV